MQFFNARRPPLAAAAPLAFGLLKKNFKAEIRAELLRTVGCGETCRQGNAN